MDFAGLDGQEESEEEEVIITRIKAAAPVIKNGGGGGGGESCITFHYRHPFPPPPHPLRPWTNRSVTACFTCCVICLVHEARGGRRIKTGQGLWSLEPMGSRVAGKDDRRGSGGVLIRTRRCTWTLVTREGGRRKD